MDGGRAIRLTPLDKTLSQNHALEKLASRFFKKIRFSQNSLKLTLYAFNAKLSEQT